MVYLRQYIWSIRMLRQYFQQFRVLSYSKWQASLLYLLGGIFIFALSARCYIPGYWVPTTMQTWVILMIGCCYPDRHGQAVLIITYTLALWGLPMLTDGTTGAEVLLGPRAGYLIGFILAVEYLQYQRRSDRSGIGYLSLIIAQATILLSGYIVLAQFLGYWRAWLYGVQPFLALECIKLYLAKKVVDWIKC